MTNQPAELERADTLKEAGEVSLKPTLGWYSATAIVAGSMIGSGIFAVSPDIARNLGTAGLLVAVWVFTGIVTVLGASSYGKLAAHMPKAGGQYVFLKESWGELPAFLYGWALLMVIQTGFLAAVAVVFSTYLGFLVPAINSDPIFTIFNIDITTIKLFSIVVLTGLTVFNCQGIQYGSVLQNVFTTLKVAALLALIIVGLFMGNHLWDGTHDWSLSLPANHNVTGSLITLFAFASVGALFSSDAWNYVTFIGGEIKEPKKNIPIALIAGPVVVVVLYILANLAYLNLMPLDTIQTAANDRVATAAIDTILPGNGTMIMALMILVSTFGCLNGLLLAGARVFYAMAKDGLLFKKFAELHPVHRSPNFSMWMQYLWASLLALSGSYGKLLDYIVFTSLVFYIITIWGLLKMGKKDPKALQMEKTTDKIAPVLYIVIASIIAFYLLFGDLMMGDFQNKIAAGEFFETKFFTSVAGLLLTASGIPVFMYWKNKQPSI